MGLEMTDPRKPAECSHTHQVRPRHEHLTRKSCETVFGDILLMNYYSTEQQPRNIEYQNIHETLQLVISVDHGSKYAWQQQVEMEKLKNLYL